VFLRVANLWKYLFRRRRLEDELDEELRSSFDMTVERHIARGMRPSDARRAARIDFEGVEQLKERVRDGLAGSGISTRTLALVLAATGVYGVLNYQTN